MCLLLVGFLLAAVTSTSAHAGSAVWRWLDHCPATHRLTIRVTLDGQELYTTVVPICRTQTWDRRVLSFNFSAPRVITWRGYRAGAQTTSQGERITGSLWLAEGDDDGLLLGVRFSAGKTILTNAVHGAAPLRRTRSVVTKGLVIMTVAK